MQANFYAFTLGTEESAATSIDQFLRGICDPKGVYASESMVTCTETSSRGRRYICGLIIRRRTSKRLAFQHPEGGTFKIEAKDILKGTNDRIVDLNFFVIDREKARGVYQQHFHGKSLSQFLLCLNELYVDMQNKSLEEERKAADESGTSVSPQTVSNHRFHLKAAQITSQEGYEEMVKRFEHIKQLEVEVESVGFGRPEMVALQGEAKKTRHILTFKAGESVAKIKAYLIEAFRNPAGYKRIKAEGTKPGGIKHVVKLDDVPERLGTVEYDGFLGDFVFDSGNWPEMLPLAHPVQSLLDRIVEPSTSALILA